MNRLLAQRGFVPLLLVICCGAIVTGAVAQSGSTDANAAVAELARRQDQLSRSDFDAPKRVEFVQESLRIRRALIHDNPKDPRRVEWLADQASDLFFEILANDGLGLTALFGAPSPAQQKQAADAAREMFECSAAAEQSIGPALLALEAAPGFASDSALQEHRRQLAEIQRDRRIPFLRGVSAFLQAEWNAANSSERRKLWGVADRILSPLGELLDGSPAIESRLYAGLAKARLGEFDAAESLFSQAARDPGATPAQIFAARMGGVLNRTVRSGPQAGLESIISIESRYADDSNGSKLFFRLLIADQRFVLLRALASQSPPALQPEALGRAFNVYTDLLKNEKGTSRETVRAIVFARLTAAVADLNASLPLAELPAIVTVAVADDLSRSESTRERAITMLEDALRDQEFDAETRAAALFVLGRSLYELGQPLLAAQRFIELAANHPSDSQAQRAIELGIAIAAEQHRQAPADGDTLTLYREGLNILLTHYPNLPAIDRWRYAAARLAMEESRFDDALRLLGQITPDSPEWLDAHFMKACVARNRAARIADATEAQTANQQTITAIDQVKTVIEAGLARTPDAQRAHALQDYLHLLRIYRAEATLRLHQPQAALEILKDFDIAGASSIVASEALKVRIAAFQELKQSDNVLREIEAFVRSAPEQADAVLVPMLASMRADVQSLIDASRDDAARDLARRTLLPVAQLLEPRLAEPKRPGAAARRQIADAFRLSGEFAEALTRYVELLRTEPNAADLLLGKAECLFALGGESSLADAMAIYKRLAAVGPDLSHDIYWLSQWRMLQIIDRVGRHTDQIAPRVERLRQQDRELGGERFRRGLESLQRKHASPS